jgi:hypothetical protein
MVRLEDKERLEYLLERQILPSSRNAEGKNVVSCCVKMQKLGPLTYLMEGHYGGPALKKLRFSRGLRAGGKLLTLKKVDTIDASPAVRKIGGPGFNKSKEPFSLFKQPRISQFAQKANPGKGPTALIQITSPTGEASQELLGSTIDNFIKVKALASSEIESLDSVSDPGDSKKKKLLFETQSSSSEDEDEDGEPA